MEADVIFAGLFGVLATLVGVIAEHMLSFSRDRRVEQSEYKALLAAMASELKTVKQGLERTITHMPRFGSAEVFRLKGYTLSASTAITVPLMQIVLDLQTVRDITERHNAFTLALISSRGDEEWSNKEAIREREEIVKQLLQFIPLLVGELEKEASK